MLMTYILNEIVLCTKVTRCGNEVIIITCAVLVAIGEKNIIYTFNPLTANEALPNYPSDFFD